ncbi:unnamed protein product [Owenia fusiformis]|uniref:Uncharacterized protein n=1 Tax=Owenia fusiformis TaxID=6347 RepID=A0A8J1TVJ4_OWEFU|nr:unnamed protein product [Owenia fusiformis]
MFSPQVGPSGRRIFSSTVNLSIPHNNMDTSGYHVEDQSFNSASAALNAYINHFEHSQGPISTPVAQRSGTNQFGHSSNRVFNTSLKIDGTHGASGGRTPRGGSTLKSRPTTADGPTPRQHYYRDVNDLIIPKSPLQLTAERSLQTGTRHTAKEERLYELRQMIDRSHDTLLNEEKKRKEVKDAVASSSKLLTDVTVDLSSLPSASAQPSLSSSCTDLLLGHHYTHQGQQNAHLDQHGTNLERHNTYRPQSDTILAHNDAVNLRPKQRESSKRTSSHVYGYKKSRRTQDTNGQRYGKQGQDDSNNGVSSFHSMYESYGSNGSRDSDDSLRHTDSSLRHNDSSLTHKESLRHNDLRLTHKDSSLRHDNSSVLRHNDSSLRHNNSSVPRHNDSSFRDNNSSFLRHSCSLFNSDSKYSSNKPTNNSTTYSRDMKPHMKNTSHTVDHSGEGHLAPSWIGDLVRSDIESTIINTGSSPLTRLGPTTGPKGRKPPSWIEDLDHSAIETILEEALKGGRTPPSWIADLEGSDLETVITGVQQLAANEGHPLPSWIEMLGGKSEIGTTEGVDSPLVPKRDHADHIRAWVNQLHVTKSPETPHIERHSDKCTSDVIRAEKSSKSHTADISTLKVISGGLHNEPQSKESAKNIQKDISKQGARPPPSWIDGLDKSEINTAPSWVNDMAKTDIESEVGEQILSKNQISSGGKVPSWVGRICPSNIQSTTQGYAPYHKDSPIWPNSKFNSLKKHNISESKDYINTTLDLSIGDLTNTYDTQYKDSEHIANNKPESNFKRRHFGDSLASGDTNDLLLSSSHGRPTNIDRISRRASNVVKTSDVQPTTSKIESKLLSQVQARDTRSDFSKQYMNKENIAAEPYMLNSKLAEYKDRYNTKEGSENTIELAYKDAFCRVAREQALGRQSSGTQPPERQGSDKLQTPDNIIYRVETPTKDLITHGGGKAIESPSTTVVLEGDRSWEKPIPYKPPAINTPDKMEQHQYKTHETFKTYSPRLSGTDQPGSMEALKVMLFKLQDVQSTFDTTDGNLFDVSSHPSADIEPITADKQKDIFSVENSESQSEHFSNEQGKEKLERAFAHLSKLKQIFTVNHHEEDVALGAKSGPGGSSTIDYTVSTSTME